MVVLRKTSHVRHRVAEPLQSDSPPKGSVNMPSLLDTIDRLTYTANLLHSTTISSKPESIGPFTQSMLHSSLQDIIREADETEYELFHFATYQDDSPLGQGTLGRREYKTATPLRTRRTAGKVKDEEPEVYLEAALRYLDRL